MEPASNPNQDQFGDVTGSRKVAKAWMIILLVSTVIMVLIIARTMSFSD